MVLQAIQEDHNMKDRRIRRVINKKIIKKRLKLIKNIPSCNHPDYKGETFVQKMVKEPGRLRDKPPLDCGTPKCLLCHSDKIFKKKKISDIKKELRAMDD